MRTKEIEIIIILLLITSLFVNPLMSQTATKLSILDTRTINTGPNGFGSEIKAEFKQRSTIGVPGTGTYSGLLTIAPWMLDNSGNKHHQLNFNDGGIFYRTGLPQDATWGAWSRLVLEDPSGNLTVNGTIRGNLTGGALRIQNDFGTLDLGGLNSYWAHIYTTLPNFLFNKGVYSLTGYFGAHPGYNMNFKTNGADRVTILNENGNVGIGTATPLAKLHINSGANNNYAAILATSNEGNNLVVSSHDTQPHSCTVFKISHEYSNNPAYRNNGYISFYRGSSVDGGFLEFGTNGSPRMLIDPSGRVGIGTSIPDEMLTVNGKIHAKEVIVALTGPLADYVFEPDYHLKPLHEVEQFVKTNKHLPGIPSAEQVEEKGLSMGEMQNKLLQKVEELTLYIIEQQKQIDQQNEKIRLLENR